MSHNAYLQGSIPVTFIRTAPPIILLTCANGLLAVADAVLLGLFVGPEALAAVTYVFPLTMGLAALSTMVATGMVTLIGQRLGAGRPDEARRLFAGAHGLALVICVLLGLAFAALGRSITLLLADGSGELAGMGYTFLGIAVLTSPLAFLLAVQSDALRSEGRLGFMALAGLLVSVANLGFNYALIVPFQLGVAGSAWGTALAQSLALGIILSYRGSGRTQLGLRIRDVPDWRTGWGAIVSLGAPRSLAFVGLALVSGATILALGLFGDGQLEEKVVAYGLITRITTFAYMPLVGMALALQAMVSNSHGAGLAKRSQTTLKFALVLALAYSALIEICLILFRHSVGAQFVHDSAVAAQVAHLLPFYAALLITLGPSVMVANYLQSIGDARRSALLVVARTYLFMIPLTFVLPLLLGELGIWLAPPVADALLGGVTVFVMLRRTSAPARVDTLDSEVAA